MEAEHTEIQPEFNGHTVLDEDGDKVGSVTDLIPDRSTLEPRWLVVDMGLLKTSHLVPVEGSYRTEDGDIIVPFTKDVLKHAPKTGGDHVLTPENEHARQSAGSTAMTTTALRPATSHRARCWRTTACPTEEASREARRRIVRRGRFCAR